MIVHANKIPLTSLRIIRGRELYEWDNNYYSLYVAKNHKANSTTVGLMELQLVSLYGKYVTVRIIIALSWKPELQNIRILFMNISLCKLMHHMY